MQEHIPAHHMSDEAFRAHLDAKYGALPALELEQNIYDMLDPTHTDEWDLFQEARYPGTQEMVDVRRELLAGIHEFARPSTQLGKLFESLAPGLDKETDPTRRLLRYEQVCADNFDFRKGAERQNTSSLTASREEVGEELWDNIMAAGDELGMETNTGLEDGERMKSYAVLGGAKNGMTNRTRYALEQLREHGATTESFDFLCSTGERDFALEEAAKLGAKNIDPGTLPTEVYADGIVLHLGTVDLNGHETPVRIFVANDIWDPQQAKMVRARTLETTKLLAEAANLQPGDNAKAVTTRFYAEFQNANAEEVVTYANGARIKVIGHSAAWAGGKRMANQLAQEIKSTVDSRCRLYRQLVEIGIAPPV